MLEETFIKNIKAEAELEDQVLTGKGKLIRKEETDQKINKQQERKEKKETIKSYIVTKLGKGSDLAVFLENYNKQHKQFIDFSKALHIAISSVEDLHRRFHQKQIIHKDLKAENMLYNPYTQHVRIIDLGLAAYLGNVKDEHIEVMDGESFYILDKIRDKGSTLGTIGFLAPEVKTRNTFSKKSDIYSMGVMLKDQLRLTEFNVPDLNNLIAKMLNESPFRRPSAMEVVHELKRIQTKLLFLRPEGPKKSLEAIMKHFYLDPSILENKHVYLDPALIEAKLNKENVALNNKENIRPGYTILNSSLDFDDHLDKTTQEQLRVENQVSLPKIAKSKIHTPYKHVHSLHVNKKPQ